MPRTEWQKNLTVDRRIVRLLSAKTYEDFPGAIRELISNAYDADATEVEIHIDLRKDTIEVSDNGNGMTPDDFDFFLRIAGQQRGMQTSPEFGRSRIGQFGIGFLALFPFGRKIRVRSTGRRSDTLFEASIPSEKYVGEAGRTIDVEQIPIPGYQVRDSSYIDMHGTTVTVTGLTDFVHRFYRKRSLPIKGSRRTIRAWPPSGQLEWFLKEDLPLDYPLRSLYEGAFSDLGLTGMSIKLNGELLYRNTPGSAILENSTWSEGGIECRYVIATPWRSVSPVEERYLKQRLRNVGIGERTSFGLGLEGRAYSRLHWLTGEIRIMKGLDELLSIDRRKFVEGPEYDTFREYFRSRLAYFANQVEAISEADRDIKRQLTSSRAAEVGSKREVIDRNIERLKSKGFSVVSKPSPRSARQNPAVRVDLKQRTVEVFQDHPSFEDNLVVSGDSYPIRYTKWATESHNPAVRRAADGMIEVNNDYPVFKSRRYGEVFKRALVLMLVLSEKATTPSSLLSKFTSRLKDEFSDDN